LAAFGLFSQLPSVGQQLHGLFRSTCPVSLDTLFPEFLGLGDLFWAVLCSRGFFSLRDGGLCLAELRRYPNGLVFYPEMSCWSAGDDQ
jgi:hypothetical protein